MRKSIKFLVAVAILGLVASFGFAQTARPAWDQVQGPDIVSIAPDAKDRATLIVSFDLVTATEGADKAVVEMLDSTGKIIQSKNVGKSKKVTKTAKFTPETSGTYTFRVRALRNKVTEEKVSAPVEYKFLFPLSLPDISIRNTDYGIFDVKWNPVNEAEKYLVKVTEKDSGKEVFSSETKQLLCTVKDLTPNTTYVVVVSAVRGDEVVDSKPINKTASTEADRIWNFTWFGQSTNGNRNTMEMIDADKMEFKLNSCTFNEKSLDIIDKGGKFTTFHDGISFYYTVIDPNTENFELTATFTVDYINTPADGQEGFGLLALDSLGEYGVSSVNHYTNSASILAMKFEEHIDGVKKTSKNTLGCRFVSGITPEVLAGGETVIAEQGKNISHAYSYDSSDIIRNGDKFTITLKKTNTGYHAIYMRPYATEETITEYIMYDSSKLQQLDKDHVYVGFAVARGCNATVTDVSFTVTDPKNDPPAMEEPPELIPLTAKVDSPSTYYTKKYPFVFNANSDGRITVTNSDGKKVINNKKVTANVDFKQNINITKGINDLIVTFTPNEDFVPGEKQAMAYYDDEIKRYVQGSKPVTIYHMIAYNSYDGDELYASPNGDAFGKGTKESPLDLASALAYVKPGQAVVLEEGTYYQPKALIIERGNDGTKRKPKTLKSAPGARAVLNFQNAGGGMQLWGNYWIVENIDVCKTDGNVKGFQVAGDYNIIRGVNTYLCGDTGLQISGTSTETYEKWPSYNLIENCTSYGNCDPAENNADGFAAKLTCGDGNVFRGCIAYSNIDDGWDLFAKAESGPIGVVVIENSIAYKNGSLLDGSGNGDGNGFKLGGDGIGIPHVLRNSIAFNNGTSGVTSNSNPNVVLENVTVYGNALRNISLYGKGNGERYFKATGVLSLNGGDVDDIKEMPSLESDNNYFWKGTSAENLSGVKFSKDIFVSTDLSIIPDRKESDNSIDMKGLLELTEAAPADAGARF